METKVFEKLNTYLYNLGLTDVYLDLLPCTFGVLEGHAIYNDIRVRFLIREGCISLTDLNGCILLDKQIIVVDNTLKLQDYEKQKKSKGPHWWSPRTWLKWLSV